MKHASANRTRKRRAGNGARPRRPLGALSRNALGALLADLRAANRLSLREVESATGRYVSNAYLSQLEQGKVQQPSPSILQRLASVYRVPYETLMQKAGYLLPSDAAERGGRRKHLAAFAIDDLTAEEEEKLLEYLAFLRSRRR